MYNKRVRGTEKHPFPLDEYNCSTYKQASQRRLEGCGNHHISTKALRTIILETIRATSAYAISNEAEFVRKVREASQVQQEKAALRQAVAEAESALAAFEQDTANVEHFLALAKKYTDFSELTTPMINEFIEKILVHASEKIDGERVQEVEVHLKYIGRFEPPAPELTPEELAEQERLRREPQPERQLKKVKQHEQER